MSDSKDSTVTYIEWAPSLPEFVPDPIYLEFMPLKDEILPAEEQPLLGANSPTADSPGYIPKYDLEEDPADYLADGGNDDDDDDEPSDDDEDDDDDVEEDEKEEHLTLADSILPPPVHRVTARMSMREQPPTLVWSEAEIDRLLAITSPPPSLLSPWSLPLPHISSPPLPLSPPLLVSSPLLPASPTYLLGYRVAMIRLRVETPSISHPLSSSTPPVGTPPLLPIALHTSSPPLLLPSTSHREGVPEVTLPPRKRLCIALGTRYEVSESSSTAAARPTRGFRVDFGFVATLDDENRRDPKREVGYGIIDTWDEMLVGMPGASVTDETELCRRMTEFVTTIRQDTDEIYMRLDDAQHDRAVGTTVKDYRIAGSRSYVTDTASRGTDSAKDTADTATTTTTTTIVIDVQLKALIDQGVGNALAARDTDRSRNGEDSHDSRMGVRRQAPPAREIETVFCIINCTVENEIKFSTGTLLGSALTCWNSHVMTVGPDVSFAMTWRNMRKTMTNKYCPRGKNKKLEVELWNLKVKESNKIERYIGRLPDMIHRSVMAYKPKIMQDKWQCSSESVCGSPCKDKPRLKRRHGSQIDITPTALDHYYDVELADERIIGLNTILRGCSLNFLTHPFNVDLMHIELGSFDAIIGIDWLAKYQAVIVCAEKIIRISWGNETLIVRGEGSCHTSTMAETRECNIMINHNTSFRVDAAMDLKKNTLSV
nr:reverse transcriptase domain-containing protein [Tanacetum cinerariifolium]